MFKKAVQAHDSTPVPQKPLKQSLFPSSGPLSHDASTQQQLRKTQAQGPRSLFRSVPDATLNSAEGVRPANTGIKRTSSGLAKALGTGGHNSFQDTASIQKITPVASQGVRSGHKQEDYLETTFFDENDFDSEPELDVQDPSTKASISYPKLPSPKQSTSFQSYPSLQKANLHSGTTRNSGYPPATREEPPPSTAPLPWSSSPLEHQEPAVKAQPLQRYAYAGAEVPEAERTQEPHLPYEEATNQPTNRPSKRRTLPWLEEEARQAPESSHSHSISSSKSISKSVPSDTPSSRNAAAPYPWNTTASAIKEQQKQLRKANKKAGKEVEETKDTNVRTFNKFRPPAIARPVLSNEQRKVLDLIVDQKKSVFFTGSAGTGKSVLLRECIRVLRQKYQKEPDRVAITASTGLAACNIGGVTLHSFSGIGLGKEDVPELVKKIKRNQKAKHRWMRTKVLIVDEISMVDADLFDKLENIARIVRSNGRPFGGIQLVVTGDFFQLPPVPDSSTRESKFSFDASTWTSSIDHTIGLHHVFRQRDPAFAGMLNEMREGRLTQNSIAAFRQLSRPLEDFDNLQATELFPTRGEVDAANSLRMRQLAGEGRVFHARDGGAITDKVARDRLLGNCMAPEVLELKKGSQVMLIKNIDEMLVNGSLGKVIGFMNEESFDSYTTDPNGYVSTQAAPDDELNPSELKQKRALQKFAATNTAQVWPLVRFTLSDGSTRDLLCNRETWKIELPNGEVQASRAQVPLILAWALSIHKAQGQTLERVKVDLGKVFENGQAYVALSRATTMGGLQVLRFDPAKVTAHKKVREFYAGLSRAELAGKGGQLEEWDEYDGF